MPARTWPEGGPGTTCGEMLRRPCHMRNVIHPVGPLMALPGIWNDLKPQLLEERLAPRRPCADHPHLRDPTIFEPVNEGVVCIELLPVATEEGSLPLRSPALVRDRELLVELHVACGQIEDRANNSEETLDAPMVPYPRERASGMEHHVLG